MTLFQYKLEAKLANRPRVPNITSGIENWVRIAYIDKAIKVRLYIITPIAERSFLWKDIVRYGWM